LVRYADRKIQEGLYMSNPISSVTQAPPVETVAKAPAPNPKAAKVATQPLPVDTVTISTSATTNSKNAATKAILQEAQETHAQTVQEANGGDSQATRLLASQAAATVTPKG
jgi:hypothetical protein